MDTEKRNNESFTQQKKQGLAFNETLSARKVLQPNFINPAAFDKTKVLVEKMATKKHKDANAQATSSVVNPIPTETGIPLQPTAQQPTRSVVQPKTDTLQSHAQPNVPPTQPMYTQSVPPQPVQVPPVQPQLTQVPPQPQATRDTFVPEPVVSQRKAPNIEIKLPEDEPIIKAERFSANTEIPPNPTEADRDAGVFAKRPESKQTHLPKKHKRWIIILLLILLLLLAYLWLKPKGETVDAFQSQTNSGNTLPIEYQPLDQDNTKPVVNGADTEEAQQKTDKPTDITLENPRPDNASQEAANGTKRTMSLLVGDDNKLVDSAANSSAPNTNAGTTNSNQPSQTNITNGNSLPTPTLTPTANTNQTAVPATTRIAPRPVATNTPEHRIVDGAKAVRPRATTNDRNVDRPRTEPMKTADVKKSSSSDITERKTSTAVKAKTPIVEATPAYKETPAPTASKSESAVGTTKVLTIPRGVSLMQVFRDNNLDIRDVNAMTKTNGAGHILNNLHAGDKIRLIVGDSGQVNELRLSNGARFIRQTDGSYIYQK